MILPILLLILGLIILVKGADWLVEGSSVLAKKFNVSDLAIGLTVVAFGTSAPELVINVFAAVYEKQDIVFGNVIGSNNFNLFMILGISGVIAPLVVKKSVVSKEIPISILATVVLYFLVNNLFLSNEPLLSRWDALILFIVFLFFLFFIYKQLKNDTPETDTSLIIHATWKIWAMIIVGLAMLILGGNLVVDNAVELAQMMGVSEKIIGLTILAAGSSAPELAVSVAAVLKKNNDLVIGNIIGSNIFNICLILSVSGFIRPVPYDTVFNTDIYLLLGGSLFLLIAMFTGMKMKLDRWEAGVLLITYIVYIGYLISS